MSRERNIGEVREVWRHPVKSLAGERIEAAPIERRFGVRGDRAWAIRDVAAGEIRGGKSVPALMQLGARYLAEPAADGGSSSLVEIELGDGRRVRSDDPTVSSLLSERLGREVELCARPAAADKDHYLRARPITDAETEIRSVSELLPEEAVPFSDTPPSVDLSIVGQYVSPPGTYFDFFDLHVVSTRSLERLAGLAPDSRIEARRFRPNLVVEIAPPDPGEASGAGAAAANAGWPELEWVGHILAIGDTRLELTMPMMRCGMTTHAQQGLPKDPRIMRTLVRDCGMNLGAGVTVLRAGAVRVGDEIRIAND